MENKEFIFIDTEAIKCDKKNLLEQKQLKDIINQVSSNNPKNVQVTKEIIPKIRDKIAKNKFP